MLMLTTYFQLQVLFSACVVLCICISFCVVPSASFVIPQYVRRSFIASTNKWPERFYSSIFVLVTLMKMRKRTEYRTLLDRQINQGWMKWDKKIEGRCKNFTGGWYIYYANCWNLFLWHGWEDHSFCFWLTNSTTKEKDYILFLFKKKV